jgi:hypothetical protein
LVGVIKRRVGSVTLVAGVAVLAAAGAAFAAGSSVHVSVPRARVSVKVNNHYNHPYKITVSGSAAVTEHLYLFIDSKKCGANPKVEYNRTGTYGTAYGYYWRTVSGRFSHKAGFATIAVTKDHACAYLSKASVRKNSASDVVAHAFKTYQVHSS